MDRGILSEIMKPLSSLLLLTSVALLTFCGCMDMDPFGMDRKRITGGYYLRRNEFGDFYLIDKDNPDVGGVLEGTVQAIGWSREVIVAKRRSNLRNPRLDGWMVVDIRAKTILGPMTDEEKNAGKFGGIPTYPASEAWKKKLW